MNHSKNSNSDLVGAFSQTISQNSLADLLAGTGDIAIDQAIDSGAIDSIPVFGTFLSVYRAQRSVRDHLFLRQIIRFLNNLESADQEKREEFIKKLREEGEIKRFGENILLILSSINNIEKPVIIGKIMAKVMEKELGYSKGMRLVSMVERTYYEDILYLEHFSPGVQENYDIADALFSSGLLRNVGIDGGNIIDPKSGGTLYELNEYGEILANIIVEN
jgi:hypothetical protein